MSDFRISKLQNEDISRGRAGQQVRAMRRVEHAVGEAKREIVKAIQSESNQDSPYAPDRSSINPNKIHKSADESNWKKVATEAQTQNFQANVTINLKKINVL